MLSADPVTTVELLRHAKAHARRAWGGGDDRSRPLDASGRGQAKWLTAHFAPDGPSEVTPLAEVRTSPLARCVETVEPLGQRADVPVVPDDRLADRRMAPPVDRGSAWVGAAWLGGRALAVLDELVAAHPGGRVLVCSHGDVLAAALAVLAGRDRLAIADARVRKGAWLTLVFAGGACLQAQAHPPAPRP